MDSHDHKKQNAAFFDICQTLVSVTTISDFTEQILLVPSENPHFKISKWMLHYWYHILRKLHMVTHVQYRNHFIFLYRGYSEKEIADLAEKYAIRLQAFIKKDIAQKLSELQRDGYAVFLVSAGLSLYLLPFARRLGVTLIATELATTIEGNYTGEIEGIDCIGEGKVKKIRQKVSGLDLFGSFAFGNDAPDIPMLSLVGNPVAVDPDPTLRTIAKEKGWKIINTK